MISQLTLGSIPGFFDLADAAISAGQPLTDDSISKISHNAKFGAVRSEILYMGYFKDADIVPAPVSPVDGYTYTYAETVFVPIHASTLSPAPGFVAGQAAFPSTAPNSGQGSVQATPWFMYIERSNEATPGKVHVGNYYWTSGGNTEGTVMVIALCQRLSAEG